MSRDIYSQSPIKPEFQKKVSGFILYDKDDGARTYDTNARQLDLGDPLTFVSQVGCNNKVESFNDNFKANFMNIHGPIAKAQCRSIDEYNEKKQLTQDICLNMAGCFKSKMNGNRNIADVINKAKENTAVESVFLLAKKSVGQMVDFQALRNYAEMKYGPQFVPESCHDIEVFKVSEYLTSAKDLKCRTGLIDKGIEQAMEHCKVPDRNCHKDYSEFVKDKKPVFGKSLASEFFSNKSQEVSANAYLQSETITKHLAEIFAADTFSAEERVNDAFNFLSRNYETLDPVFKNYYDRSIESRVSKNGEDLVRNSLLVWLKQSSPKSIDLIIAKLEDLRKSEAKAMLDKKCKSGMTMNRLCLLTADVLSGVDVEVDRKEFNRMLSQEKPLSSNSLTFNQELADNISRCNTFLLSTFRGGYGYNTENLSGEYDLFSSMDDGFSDYVVKKNRNVGKHGVSTKISINEEGALLKFLDGPEIFTKKPSERMADNRGADLVLVNKLANNEQMPEVYRKDSDGFMGPVHIPQSGKKDFGLAEVEIPRSDEKYTRSIAPEISTSDNRVSQQDRARLPQTQVQGQMPSSGEARIEPNYQAIQNSHYESSKEAAIPKKENSELQSKVAELENRLKKLNGEGATKKNEKEIAKNDLQESSSAKELASVKEQIENFKKGQMKSIADQNAQLLNDNSFKEKTINPKNSKTDNEVKPASESVNASRSIASSAPARSESSEGSFGHSPVSSAASGASSTIAAQTDSKELKSEGRSSAEQITLTKIETNSNGAAAPESIAKLIFAEAGQPFYIEEEGMVKYVVPEIADGKILLDEKGLPIYKKIVKGKVGDYKLTDNKKVKVPKPTSPADVKRMDEQKGAPAIRYKDFKDAIKASLPEAGGGA